MLKQIAVAACFLATPILADVGLCPIDADFGNEPETATERLQIGTMEITSTRTRSFVVGGLVQIECLEADYYLAFGDTDEATFLTNYARFFSVQSSGPAYSEDHPVQHQVLQGNLTIQGIEVEYTFRFFRFDDCFALVVTAVPGGRPTRDIEHFLESLRVY